MKTDINKIQEQFEDYVKKYNSVLSLANKYKTTPGEITEFLFSVGVEALNRTEDILTGEFKVKTKNILEFFRDFEDLKKKVNTKINVDKTKNWFKTNL